MKAKRNSGKTHLQTRIVLRLYYRIFVEALAAKWGIYPNPEMEDSLGRPQGRP